MTVTLRQLADELELSPATVSLALRGSEQIAEKTRKRVNELAERYDYVQSHFGRALQSRRSGLVGILLPQLTKSFYNEVLTGAGDAAVEADYNLLIGWALQKDQTCSKQIRLLLEKEIDALVVAFIAPEVEKGVARFLRRKKPVVYCFCNLAAPEGSSWVYTDDFTGGRLAVRALCEAGHRHLLCDNTFYSRFSGNLAEAKEWGAEVIEYYHESEAFELLKKDPRLTAVVCSSDEKALQMFHPLAEMGFKVPQDVSLIGYDGIALGGEAVYRLSTINQQRSELGQRAVEIAVKLMAEPEAVIQEYLQPSLLLRDTIAAPGRAFR